MSKGKASGQTWQPTMDVTFLARASATTLTWLNLTEEKLDSKHWTSSTIFPKEDSKARPWETAAMIVAESPSTITRWSSSSAANWTALRQARASMSATDEASGVSIDRAPRETPRQSRTITPSPAEFEWLKRAASKFTFTKPGSGGRHWCRAEGRGRGSSVIWLAMNSWSRAPATALIFERAWAGRPKWIAFRLFHKHRLIVARHVNLV